MLARFITEFKTFSSSPTWNLGHLHATFSSLISSTIQLNLCCPIGKISVIKFVASLNITFFFTCFHPSKVRTSMYTSAMPCIFPTIIHTFTSSLILFHVDYEGSSFQHFSWKVLRGSAAISDLSLINSLDITLMRKSNVVIRIFSSMDSETTFPLAAGVLK